MTMVHERTRSVVQTEQFLRDIMRNKSVSESLRIQAESLLRHYPDADKIWRAGRQEKWQRKQLLLLEEKGALPFVLGLLLVFEPLFCDQRQGDVSANHS